MLPAAFVILFVMLGVIWVPSFLSLGDLFSYAEKATYHNVSLLSIFQAELLVISIVWLVLMSYSKTAETIDGDTYVRRHLILVMFYIGQVFVGFFAGGFLVHQDASWYEVVHDGNQVMPAQAVILLICYPMYSFFGGSAFLYAKTHLPKFLKNKELAFMVLTFAPFAFLPYHDASMMEVRQDIMELAYLVAYWTLSTAWVVFGIGYLIIKSAQELLKGLKDPYGDM
jgi:hypothetical protein